ncbi:dinuclear metal center YbgI/SA1388 family protein [Neisseria sp. HSC-16F19]|nr:Nif3-like dinuclear metal center hexameric protein [Neisseria sp. HSC-16F19]MCP2039585.1 dinuclear metal center YbgI/SA1388 family protein [Neisseria sp. HSC-16F19]
MIMRSELLHWCHRQLAVDMFKDYAPNGLQVEGREQIGKIVCAVTASRAAIDFAVAEGADMLLVHHGLFWKSEPAGIVGWKKQRIATLLRHEINLVGYHLPLDAHKEWGNNARLAARLGWQAEAYTGEQDLLVLGRTEQSQTLLEMQQNLHAALGRAPLILADDLQHSVSRLAWCTGGAQSFFQAAVDAGVDAFVTGEVSEAQYHLARETGVAFIAAGHHATERYGVQALAAAIEAEFGIPFVFFDEDNPV